MYNPEYEGFGNYVPSILHKRYNVFLHIDETYALYPLHMPEIKEDRVSGDISYWIMIDDIILDYK